MIKDKISYDYQNRNLSEVFKELQEIKSNAALQKSYTKKHKFSIKNFNIKTMFSSKVKNITIQLPHIFIMLFTFIALFFNKKIFAKSDISDYEINNNALNIQNIISENANINTFKEQCVTEYNVVFKTIYSNNATLPKGEEVITKEGTLGKEKVTYFYYFFLSLQ